MSKLRNDISKMIHHLLVIEYYNNFMQLGATEDITYLRNKVNDLLQIKEEQLLIKEFTYCAKMVNMYYNEIDNDFKIQILKDERKSFEN